MIKQSTEIPDRLIELDALINHQSPAPVGEQWFVSRCGSAPVLVSAPHACSHARNGEYKLQEEFTGALALYLAEVCNCHVIATCYQTDEDPNWQEQGAYKDAIRTIVDSNDIRFIVDLHGMKVGYHMGVAIGTINGSSCSAPAVESHFINAGFVAINANQLDLNAIDAWRRVVVDHPKFTGGVVNHTVTRFASEQLQVDAVQIELSSEVRVVDSPASDDGPGYRGNPEAIVSAVSALQSLILSIK